MVAGGWPGCYDGTCHDSVLLNVLSQTRATRAAIAYATQFLRQAFGSDCARVTEQAGRGSSLPSQAEIRGVGPPTPRISRRGT
jgi:hypothetical protein